MDNKITIGSVVIAVGVASAVLTQIDFKSKTPGPKVDDKCVAGLTALAVNNQIRCELGKIHISKWSPSHPSDDDSLTMVWLCNGQPAPDQKCLADIVDDGVGVTFKCSENANGLVECKPEVVKAPEK
jgi:hypothetical protein